MSLNEFFAANPGGVYLRPVGLSDCFSMPGLPHGCKPPPPPPPLAMQHPCPPGPQKPRTMATVSPLHQVTPPQSNLAAYEAATANSLNAFGSSQRTSSFAAALRKLAKQAGDPITGEKDISQISPVSSPALAAQRSLTPKRNGSSAGQNQPMYLSSNNVHQQVPTSYSSSSPPVVTIAPSRPHPTHTTSDSRKLQVMDLAGISQSNQNSSVTNGHLSDPISLKLDVAKSTNRSSAGGEKWEDHATSKSLPTSSGSSSQSRPHATIAPLPRPDDSLTSSRGFQPYRSADDIRTSMPPHHLSPFEPHPQASYPYAPAFLPPPHLPHPAYRFDDPLFLDRFGLLRSQVMPFHAQPAMMATPAAFYPQSRYDLLAQTLSLSSGSLHLQERLKLEEERRQREKEAELDLSRKREQERREKEQKEKEQQQQQQQHKEKERRDKDKTHRAAEKIDHHSDSIARTNHHHHHQHHTTQSHSKRSETLPRRNDQHIANTINRTPPPVTSSSTPLNLVVQPTSVEQHPKKETELWMPWQQQQQQQHHHHPHHHQPHLSNNHEETPPNLHIYRPPPPPVAIHTQVDNHQISHPQKDQQANDKFQPPFGFPIYGDKKGIPAAETNSLIMDNDQKRPQLQPLPVMPPMDITDAKRAFPTIGPNSNNFVNTNNTNNHGNGNYKKFDSIHHHIAELSKKDNSSSSSNTNEWKHEKLQKAYANNHRKNVTEVKKYREESQLNSNCITNANSGLVNGSSSSHFVSQQQRKQPQQPPPQHINGLIKPTMSQDEGMHARLLETEKCRLEYSNHSVNKILPILPPPPPPTASAAAAVPPPNDKLSIQSMVQTNNHQLVNGSDPSSQLYIEHHLMSMLNKKNVETSSIQLRSKLDKEAEDMKKKGYVDGECDEINLKEFLVITKGPPLPMDENPKKMRFLEIFGLTSRIKRKQIELDIYLKRRKVLHEDENCLPLQMEPEPSSLPDGNALLESFRNLDKISERLRCEGGAEKSEFFLNLGLSPLSKMQKEERTRLRNIAEDEKKRRALRHQGKESCQALRKSKIENDDSKSEAVTTAGRQSLKPVSITSAKTIQLSLNSALQGNQVPYTSATAKDESVNGGQALAANCGSSSSFVLPQEPYDFKRNKFRTKYSFKRGHSLKCEWKPATLLSPQNNHGRTDFGTTFVKTEPKVVISKSISTQVDLSSSNGDSLDDKSKSSFNWPGLDAVIEAYYRHHKDQLVEKDLLKERCNQLKGRQEDLTKEANQLSRSMSDLLKQKRDQDEKKLQLEQALQKLKQFIQAAR